MKSSLAFGVGWDNNVHVHLHTMVMLRYEIVPYIGLICARYLQSRILKWPLSHQFSKKNRHSMTTPIFRHIPNIILPVKSLYPIPDYGWF